jgi:acylaminoacyl-peptidase
MTIRQIADPQVSPDGRRIAFSVGTPDLTANRIQRTVYLGDLTGGVLKAVTAKDVQAENPRWSPDSRFLYYLAATSSGVQQVWRQSPEDGRPEPVTVLPLPVENFEPGPDGRFLILSMAVFPGKTPDESAALFQDKPKGRGSGRTYDHLMIRHWDAWRDGARNHIFVYRLADGVVRDLMGDMDADCPSRPFGGTEDFSLSPDGKTVVFSAKTAGTGEAWSTNYDLFLVPVDGSAPPQRITSNPAADIQPRFPRTERPWPIWRRAAPVMRRTVFGSSFATWPPEKRPPLICGPMARRPATGRRILWPGLLTAANYT